MNNNYCIDAFSPLDFKTQEILEEVIELTRTEIETDLRNGVLDSNVVIKPIGHVAVGERYFLYGYKVTASSNFYMVKVVWSR